MIKKTRQSRMNAEFVIYCGPMWSGKTTRLTAAIERHRIRKTDVLCFKPEIDGRYASTSIVTHSGSRMDALPVNWGHQITEHVQRDRPEVIAVDEAFMIDGCADALIKIFTGGVSVYVSSIELSANLRPFPEIEKMMPFATRIEKCTAVCVSCGEDAALTHRQIPSLEEISVGGADSYEPMCWNCHPLVASGRD
jgi:thymidine kinase